MGGTGGSMFDRIDHLSVYADDRRPLVHFLVEGLGMQPMVPPTTYHFGHEDTPFRLELLHAGSGMGLEVYTDPDLQSWRQYFRRNPGTVVNVGLQPAGLSLDRAASLMLRHSMKASPPVAYHFTDAQRAEDALLPRWLHKKMPFQMGDALHMAEEGVKWASRTQDLPQLTYFYAVQWHKDWAGHPAAVRSRMTALPFGPLGITACNRVFWSVPWEENELMKLGDQMRRFLTPVSQPATHELAIHFPEGPELYVVAEADPARHQLLGRVQGWELAVTADLATVLQVLENNSLSVAGPCSPEEWRAAEPSARLCVDLSPVGGHGLTLHLVPAKPRQRRLALGAAAYGRVAGRLGSTAASQQQLPPPIDDREGPVGALVARSQDPVPGTVPHAASSVQHAVQLSVSGAVPALPAGALAAGAPSIAAATAPAQFAPPPSLTVAARTGSANSLTPGGRMGKAVRYNDRRPVKPAPEPEAPRSWLQELWHWQRL